MSEGEETLTSGDISCHKMADKLPTWPVGSLCVLAMTIPLGTLLTYNILFSAFHSLFLFSTFLQYLDMLDSYFVLFC
jgi:hypothetical protein